MGRSGLAALVVAASLRSAGATLRKQCRDAVRHAVEGNAANAEVARRLRNFATKRNADTGGEVTIEGRDSCSPISRPAADAPRKDRKAGHRRIVHQEMTKSWPKSKRAWLFSKSQV